MKNKKELNINEEPKKNTTFQIPKFKLKQKVVCLTDNRLVEGTVVDIKSYQNEYTAFVSYQVMNARYFEKQGECLGLHEESIFADIDEALKYIASNFVELDPPNLNRLKDQGMSDSRVNHVREAMKAEEDL